MKDTEEVAVFWDYENCPVPTNVSGYATVDRIRSLAHPNGSVKLFKAYLGLSDPPTIQTVRSQSIRSELQVSGVSLIDCPHNGRKEVADKMIIVDMLGYAMDNPAPTTIILISGDRDFAYALSFLRLRRYRIILLTLPNAHISLKAQATLCLDWVINDSSNPRDTLASAATIQNKSALLLYAGKQNCSSADVQYFGQMEQIQYSINVEDSFLIRPPELNTVSGNGFSSSPSDPSTVPRPSSTNTSSGGSSKYMTPSVSPQPYYNASLSQSNSATTVGQYRSGFGPQVTSPTVSDASEVTTSLSSPDSSNTEESVKSSLLDPRTQQVTIVAPTSKPTTVGTPVAPKIFAVLVSYLQKLRVQGLYHPLRSQVAVGIAKGGETYRLAGVQKFGQYVAEAQKAGIVTLGGLDGTAWITLTPNWYHAKLA